MNVISKWEPDQATAGQRPMDIAAMYRKFFCIKACIRTMYTIQCILLYIIHASMQKDLHTDQRHAPTLKPPF